MKTKLLSLLALAASLTSTFSQLTIPTADGSDGPFVASATPVDLSQAVPGDALTYSNSGGNAGRGIYDAARWVIVFKYSSVSVPSGTTVTFTNHPSHAPVVWLVQGNVNIAGTVNLNGKIGVAAPAGDVPIEPGPGGFRGGATGQNGVGAGLGPGGGATSNSSGTYNTVYGRPEIFPLIGGSGASGFNTIASGGGGGGAILIACPSTIQLSGSITALGGPRYDNNPGGLSGSGGAIKLVADQVTGTGTLNAATTGRVRIETNSLSQNISTIPSTIAVPPAATPILFQSAASPVVKIVSVTYGATTVPVPPDPTAPLINSADLSIQSNVAAQIDIKTYNFATAGATVTLRIAGKYGSATNVNATIVAGGTTAETTWRVSTILPAGFSTMQVRATQN